jgi:hypothetical protein
MRNRNGTEYHFQKIDEQLYTIVGDLDYWRYGGKEGQETVDYADLGFVDPSGGPFISAGYKINGYSVVRISTSPSGEKIYFEVE